MKKSIQLLLVLIVILSTQTLYGLTITESAGWLESAFVKWTPVTNATSYNVYYTGQGITDRKIDNQLIRSYGTYFRADVMGLTAGTYTIKVAAVIQGAEAEIATTGSLTVLAQDRTGFAFANSRVPGAYKADGTIKDNAVILYVTEANKNTISCNVTGATTNPCVGIQTILDGIKKGKDARPFLIRMIGQVKDPTYTLNGDLVVENANNATSFITFEGIGDDAVADGWGLRLKAASNVEVRNLGTMNCDSGEGDNIGLQQDNEYVWVHNCDLFYGNAGSDADQIKGDGAMDCKKSTYVTFSYNHFWDSGKCNLLGLSEGSSTGLYITYHHNWYDHSDSRHPRVRYYSAHVYNNLYDGNAKYGVGSTEGSSVFVENNFFRNCKYPMMISMQGTDIFYGTGGTFSGEDGGFIKSFNNTISGQTRYVAYNATTYPVEFDAVEAATRAEIIPATIKSKQGANTYNNFDTDAAHYVKNMTPETPEVAKNNVMLYSGRVSGGDLKWTFNNSVDDASYAVNTGLKAALTSYTTKLVSVQGESGSGSTSSQTLAVTSNNNSQIVSSGTAIADIVFTWGGDATDASVTGLPANGLSFVKNATAKTITVSGTPTANTDFTVTTSGSAGSAVSVIGSITVSTGGGGTSGDAIHNFTLSGKVSSFYTITGNLSTSYGTVTYEQLTLTQCLKMESSTSITFNASSPGTLTLVFNSSYTGSVQIDGTVVSPTGGIITRNLTAGAHTILKGSGSNYLFYMRYAALNPVISPNSSHLSIYPNPVSDKVYVRGNQAEISMELYTLTGQKLMQKYKTEQFLDMSAIRKGNYLIKVIEKDRISVFKIVKE